MSGKRKKVVGAIVAVVVLGSVVGFNVTRESRQRVTVQGGQVARKDLVAVVTASGEVKPKRYVNVGANVSGRIVELRVKEGDRVRRDQVLVRIESERFEAAERQSGAAVQAARADLQRAQADLEVSTLVIERTRKMWEERLISAQAYDQAEAEVKMKTAGVEAARKRVAQLQAALDSNRDELRKTTVLSPMDGVVTSLPKEEGEVVIGAQSFNPTVIMTVADLSVMECEVMVDETDIRNLALGQEAEVRVDALEGVRIKGTVTEIGASALVRGGTAATQTAGLSTGTQAKDFKVKITLDDPPAALRPGLNATADIVTARRQGVLAVPIQAVVVRPLDADGKVVDPEATPPPGGGGDTEDQAARARPDEREGVFLIDKDKAAFRAVETGVMGETDVEILGGLDEGQSIVTGTYRTLRTLKDEARIKLEKKKRS